MREKRRRASLAGDIFWAMRKLPPDDVMYQALLDRDSGFNGVFFVGVKSTQIFCRPICPARKPKRKNVEFFPDSQSALYAGFRACKRCCPMDREQKPPKVVTQLLELLESKSDNKFREQDLRDLGLDPSTVRRQFQKYLGMSFHQYQRAKRMGQALHELRSGAGVTQVQVQLGYESGSGFWQSFRKMFGDPPGQADQVNTLVAKWIDTPLGAMLALANDEGLHLLEFVDRPALETQVKRIRAKQGCVIVPGEHEILSRISQELSNYFSGLACKFEVPVVLCGSLFEQEVWRELARIPEGETTTYQSIASKISRANAVRAVGRANGKNCLAIIIPCHRVIGSDGKLTGYGGGLWRKQWLLDHEAGRENRV